MEILKELVAVVSKVKAKQIELLDSKPTKVNELYQGIREDRFDDDQEALLHFYGNRKKYENYKKLKASLKKKLLNTLFFIDLKSSNYNNLQKAYYSCWKDWAAAKILFGKSARIAGVNIARKTLKKAQAFEFTDLCMDIARTLRLHYGTFEPNTRKFDHYNELFQEASRIFQSESRAEELYTRLTLQYMDRKRDKTAIAQEAEEAFNELWPAMQQYRTQKLLLPGFYIQIMGKMAENDYRQTIAVCDSAIAFLEQKSYRPIRPIQIFQHQQLICYTQLRDFERGRELALKSEKLIEKGTFNWFKHQELFLLLSLHTEQYQSAYEVFLETRKHRRFRFMSGHIKERWRIFGAYLHYLIALGEICPRKSNVHAPAFRLGKFLNEVPIFSKDKRGMNIPILVIQTLFLILNKNYDKAIDRIEAVEKYCYRYLRRDEHFRSNCFIKMLLQISINGFHRKATIRHTASLLAKLKSVPLDVANQAHEIEIIPYERLWGFALDALEDRRVK